MATVIVSDDAQLKLVSLGLEALGSLATSKILVHKSSRFEFKYKGTTYQFNGTGFSYDSNNIPKSKGTITSLVAYDVEGSNNHASKLYSIKGLDLKVADITKVVATFNDPTDDQNLVKTQFAGNDSFSGGKRGDYFIGYDGNDKFKGNAGNDKLEGGNGNDKLDGGLGKDKLYGNQGDDTYLVDNKSDKIYEKVGEGSNDKVQASASYKLSSTVEIEYLATNSKKGTADINLTGNKFDQDIDGNAGKNKIDGKGGNDDLQGFGGKDTFIFSTALDAANNVDTIKGYVVGEDRIQLSKTIFAALDEGDLTNAEFADHFIYDDDSGHLSYDADGKAGPGAEVLFAVMASHNGGHPDLTAADFIVV